MKLSYTTHTISVEIEVDDSEQALLEAYHAVKDLYAKTQRGCENAEPLCTVPLVDTRAVLAQLTPPIDVMSQSESEEEVDSAGESWVAGVHSASKRKDKSGRWVKARSVRIESRMPQAVELPQPMNVPPPAPVAPPPPPPPPPASAPGSYDRLLEILRKRTANSNFNPTDITRIFAAHGVQNVLQLQADQVKLRAVIEELESTL